MSVAMVSGLAGLLVYHICHVNISINCVQLKAK